MVVTAAPSLSHVKGRHALPGTADRERARPGATARPNTPPDRWCRMNLGLGRRTDGKTTAVSTRRSSRTENPEAREGNRGQARSGGALTTNTFLLLHAGTGTLSGATAPMATR